MLSLPELSTETLQSYLYIVVDVTDPDKPIIACSVPLTLSDAYDLCRDLNALNNGVMWEVWLR